MRTHVVLPDNLVKDIDALVGKRKRSEFIAEAVRDVLKRERLLKVLAETAGTLDMSRHPEWATSEMVAEWVRAQRRIPSAYDKRVARERQHGEVSPRRKRAS